MSDRFISIEGVAKRFTIHHERARSLQEALLHAVRRRGWREEFWALRDVSFAVEPGDALGVVGANGSGKSTLLKLITGIYSPTSGHMEINGSISALLEFRFGQAGRLWSPSWTMRPLGPRPRSSPSSSLRLIQPHAGPVPMADRPSLPTPRTI